MCHESVEKVSECSVCSVNTKVNVNIPTMLGEDQVQKFIDYITQKNEVSLSFIKYLAYEWRINPTQRSTLQHFRNILDVTNTNQAILFLLCSKGLGEIKKGKKRVLLERRISLKAYFEIIELIVQHGKGFQFDEEENTIIAGKVEELKSEPSSEVRVFCVLRLYLYYMSCKSRCFATMKNYLRDFVELDVSSISDFVILHDYYQAAYFFFWHFCETDSDQVEIRDLLIDATRRKMDDLSRDSPKKSKLIRRSVKRTSKKKICFLSHVTSLYGPYANTRAFYSFLKGMYSSLADQFDFYWYALESTTDEAVKELKGIDVKIRRFDAVSNAHEKMVHLLNAFDSDEIDVVINDYPNFWAILLYSIRVAPIQIYFSFGFVYFEFEGVDYLLLPRENNPNNKIKTDIIDYDSYNWLESRFLEGPNSADDARDTLEVTFYPKVRQLGSQVRYVIGCYGRFEKINKEYLSVITAILQREEAAVFFVFGPGDRLLTTNYFMTTGLQDRVIISGASDPHVLGWGFDVFCEQWPIWSGQSSLEVMAKGIPVVSYMHEDLALFIEPYASLRDPELVAASYQEYIDIVIRLLGDKDHYEIKQNTARKISRKVTNLDERAKNVGTQILLALERKIKSEISGYESSI